MSYFYWMAILGLAICLSIVVSVAKEERLRSQLIDK